MYLFIYLLSSTSLLRSFTHLNDTSRSSLSEFWFNFFKLEETTFSLHPFQSWLQDWMKGAQGKVVKVVLHLPDFVALHLCDGLLRERVLVSGVLDVGLPWLVQELHRAREEVRQQLLQHLHRHRPLIINRNKVIILWMIILKWEWNKRTVCQ